MAGDQTLLMRLIVDQRQAVKGLVETQKAAGVTGSSLDMVGKKATKASGGAGMFVKKLRPVTLQLSQVSQQASMTGDVLGAMAIQLPDIGLAFGIMGTVIGAAAGALLMLAKDMDFFTDQSDKFEESIKNLGTAFSDLSDIYKNVSVNSQGELFSEQIRRGEIAAKMREIGFETDNVLDSYEGLFDANIGDRLKEIAIFTKEFEGGGASGERFLQSAVDDFTADFKMTVESAKELRDVMLGLESDAGLESNVEAARELEERLFAGRNASDEAYAIWKKTHDLLKLLGGELETINARTAMLKREGNTLWESLQKIPQIFKDNLTDAWVDEFMDFNKEMDYSEKAVDEITTAIADGWTNAIKSANSQLSTFATNAANTAKNIWNLGVGTATNPRNKFMSYYNSGLVDPGIAVNAAEVGVYNTLSGAPPEDEPKKGGGGLSKQAKADAEALKLAKESVETYNDAVEDLWDTMGSAVTDGVTDIFSQLSQDIVDGQADWRDYAAIAIRVIGKIADAWAQAKIAEMFGSFGQGGGGASSGIGKFISGLFGGGGGFSMMAKGDIVTGPTKAIIGEAGPEAVLPVTRMPNGDLGVGVTGGGSNSDGVNIIINNNAAGVEVSAQQGQNGAIVIAVEQAVSEVTRQIRSGGSIARQLESNYSLRRQGS